MRRRLDLDFRARPLPCGPAGAALLALGAAAAIGATMQYLRVDAELAASRDRVEMLQARHAPAAPTAAVALPPPVVLGAAGAVAAQLSLPWVALFHAIEQARDARVALLAIEPDAKRGSVRLTGEAAGLDAVLAYVRKLQRQRSLTDVALTEHEIADKEPGQPVRFTVTATWGVRS